MAWTWEKLLEHKDKLSSKQVNKIIAGFMPDDIRKIGRKIDRDQELTPAEEARLDEWEEGEQSGPAGSIMHGFKKAE